MVCNIYFFCCYTNPFSCVNIISSLLFYFYGEPIYILVMIGSILSAYIHRNFNGEIPKTEKDIFNYLCYHQRSLLVSSFSTSVYRTIGPAINWRRWHISLSQWFRDYVYIPLGGNRVGKVKLIRNIFVVWMLTGLWHGANWTFILWGLLFGANINKQINTIGSKKFITFLIFAFSFN